MRTRFQEPKNWHWGTMVNADGVALRTGRLETGKPPRAHIVIGPGLSEFGEKYFEMARILTRLGYHVHTMDWRGQGGSPRFLADTDKRHANGLDRDVRDLTQFVKTCVPDTAPKIYIGHSLGGLIGFLAMRADPALFRAGVLNAPAFGVGDKRLAGFESVLARLPLSDSLREHYIPGGKGWVLRDDPNGAKHAGAFTSDPERKTLQDAWTTANPALRIGAPTIGFVQDLSRAMTQARRRGVPESVKTPLLIFSAGQDHVVRSGVTFNLAARIPGAIHTHFATARHETMIERPDIRRPLMRGIYNFIRTNLGAAP